MIKINKAIITGNLVDAPKAGKAGETSYANFRIAHNRNKKETAYIDVKVYGKQAEACGKHLVKGQEVLIEGYSAESPKPRTASSKTLTTSSTTSSPPEGAAGAVPSWARPFFF